MIKLRKSNVVLRVEEENVQKYLNDGFSYADAPEVKKANVLIAPKIKEAKIEEEIEKEEKIVPKAKGKK